MKRLLVCSLTVALLLLSASVGISALSPDVDASTWADLELEVLFVQEGGDLYSDMAEDYYEFWWEAESPEMGSWCQAATINMRGFALSPDGRYAYLGTLNGGTGTRGVVVLDIATGVCTDLYYLYDGDSGLVGSPYSYAKGIAADDRGYVYVGFAYSKNYNIVNLGIAEQKDDGTLEEVWLDAVYEFGAPGDEGGIHVGVNGVDVAHVGDKYYCYVMVNYDHDALYCYDVTDPASPKLNKEFGENGAIVFSEPSNTVAGSGFTLKEGQYLDVDEDGVIWLCVNANEGKDGIMRIAPDGSACVDVIEMKGIYCVEHEGGFLLCGMKDGSAVVVLDDASYETVATIPLTEEYGDRVVRIQVVHDVLFVCDAGSDTTNCNAIHVAPLTADGQAFLEGVVASLNQGATDETAAETQAVTDASEDGTQAVTEETTEASADHTTEVDETTADVSADGTSAVTDATGGDGCGSVLAVGSCGLLLSVMAAAVVLRKKD